MFFKTVKEIIFFANLKNILYCKKLKKNATAQVEKVVQLCSCKFAIENQDTICSSY